MSEQNEISPGILRAFSLGEEVGKSRANLPLENPNAKEKKALQELSNIRAKTIDLIAREHTDLTGVDVVNAVVVGELWGDTAAWIDALRETQPDLAAKLSGCYADRKVNSLAAFEQWRRANSNLRKEKV